MVSIVCQNGNVENVAAPVTDQVDTQDVHTRANARRLSQRLRGLKGHLTREVKYCTQKVEHFHTLMDAAQPQTQMMVEFARNILDNLTRCQTKQAEVEKGLVELVKLKTEIWDINDDTGLETFIAQMDAESDIYYTKVEKSRTRGYKTPVPIKGTGCDEPSLTNHKVC